MTSVQDDHNILNNDRKRGWGLRHLSFRIRASLVIAIIAAIMLSKPAVVERQDKLRRKTLVIAGPPQVPAPVSGDMDSTLAAFEPSLRTYLSGRSSIPVSPGIRSLHSRFFCAQATCYDCSFRCPFGRLANTSELDHSVLYCPNDDSSGLKCSLLCVGQYSYKSTFLLVGFSVRACSNRNVLAGLFTDSFFPRTFGQRDVPEQ